MNKSKKIKKEFVIHPGLPDGKMKGIKNKEMKDIKKFLLE